ncbi:MAG: Gfo/Idh/MocA family oxidoreductase [Cyanobacteria bacterium J06634_5]
MVVRVGIVGTGYAAKVRARAFSEDRRSCVKAVAGRDFARTRAFAETQGVQARADWQQLIADPEIDLVVIATVSSLHGDVAEAALHAGKPVVVEYPLSLDLAQAKRLVALSVEKGLLLHVEHIELLGGLHLAMRSHLTSIGDVHYLNYRTLNPQMPAPMKWTYQPELFGFPFCGALSRVHRLTHLFGKVSQVDCCMQMVPHPDEPGYVKSLLSSGRLVFSCGLIAELTYGKGERLWIRRREVEMQGSLGALTFVGNEGTLTTAEGSRAIVVAPRKGLFVQDTKRVLDYLTAGNPLYVSAAESLYALTVGDALKRASQRGQTITLE